MTGSSWRQQLNADGGTPALFYGPGAPPVDGAVKLVDTGGGLKATLPDAGAGKVGICYAPDDKLGTCVQAKGTTVPSMNWAAWPTVSRSTPCDESWDRRNADGTVSSFLDPNSQSAGEEWQSGPYAVLLSTTMLAKTLRSVARGESPLDAVRFGCALASLSVTRPGTAPSMPTLAEIEAVLLGEPVKSGSASAHQS